MLFPDPASSFPPIVELVKSNTLSLDPVAVIFPFTPELFIVISERPSPSSILPKILPFTRSIIEVDPLDIKFPPISPVILAVLLPVPRSTFPVTIPFSVSLKVSSPVPAVIFPSIPIFDPEIVIWLFPSPVLRFPFTTDEVILKISSPDPVVILPSIPELVKSILFNPSPKAISPFIIEVLAVKVSFPVPAVKLPSNIVLIVFISLFPFAKSKLLLIEVLFIINLLFPSPKSILPV